MFEGLGLAPVCLKLDLDSYDGPWTHVHRFRESSGWLTAVRATIQSEHDILNATLIAACDDRGTPIASWRAVHLTECDWSELSECDEHPPDLLDDLLCEEEGAFYARWQREMNTDLAALWGQAQRRIEILEAKVVLQSRLIQAQIADLRRRRRMSGVSTEARIAIAEVIVDLEAEHDGALARLVDQRARLRREANIAEEALWQRSDVLIEFEPMYTVRWAAGHMRPECGRAEVWKCGAFYASSRAYGPTLGFGEKQDRPDVVLANVRAALSKISNEATQASAAEALSLAPKVLSYGTPSFRNPKPVPSAQDATNKQIVSLNRQRVEAARRVHSLSIVLCALRPASPREIVVGDKLREAKRYLAHIDAKLASVGAAVFDFGIQQPAQTDPIVDFPEPPSVSTSEITSLASLPAQSVEAEAPDSALLDQPTTSRAVQKPEAMAPSPDANADELTVLSRGRIVAARRVRSFTVVSARSREAQLRLAQIDARLVNLRAAMIEASSPPAAQTSPPNVDRPKPYPESTTPAPCHQPSSQSGKLTLERDMLADHLQQLEASQAKFFPGSRKSEKNRLAREDLVQRIAALNTRIARGDKFPAFKIVPPRVDLRDTAGTIEAQRDALRSELQELERRGTDASDGPDRMEVYRARRAQMLWRISQLDERIAAETEAAKAGT